MIALLIGSAVLVVVSALLGRALILLDRERDAHAETREELHFTQKKVRDMSAELTRVNVDRVKTAAQAIRLVGERFTLRRELRDTAARLQRVTAETAEMRLRGRILPDLGDPLERLVFDDGGPSPIFDAMPGGVAVATLIGASA